METTTKSWEGTSKPPTITIKRRKKDITAAEIFRSTIKNNDKKILSYLNEEDRQRILAGGPKYKVKGAEVC